MNNRIPDILIPICAIIWTIVLVLDIFICILGGQPNWVQVFAPVSLLVIIYWSGVYNRFRA